MKVAVYSESSADEAALRILAGAALGQTAEPIDHPDLRSRGWPFVWKALPNVIKALYYRTDADVLLVVVDADLSPVHLPEHDEPDKAVEKCRLCQLRKTALKGLGQVRARQGRPPLRVALGLAVPCIEAWFRCGLDPHVTEAAWLQVLQSKKSPEDVKRLKRAVYGTDRPGLELETARMADEAQRLAKDLSLLETWFPNGFGCLLRDLRACL
jgi:hypothetical protein